MGGTAYIEVLASTSRTGWPHYEPWARLFATDADIMTLLAAAGVDDSSYSARPPGLSSLVAGEADDDEERTTGVFVLTAEPLMAERDRDARSGATPSLFVAALLAALAALGAEARVVFWAHS